MKTKALILLSVVLFLVGCKSKKHVETDTQPVVESQMVTKPGTGTTEGTRNEEVASINNLTARIRASVDLPNQGFSTTGSLKIKKDTVIQVVLMDPILGIAEVGRLEITPEKITVIDKLKKQFVNITYDKIAQLSNKQITFTGIQNTVWSEATRSDNGNLSYTLPTKNQSVKLDISLSNVKYDGNWVYSSQITSKYVEVAVEQLLGSLIQQ